MFTHMAPKNMVCAFEACAAKFGQKGQLLEHLRHHREGRFPEVVRTPASRYR